MAGNGYIRFTFWGFAGPKWREDGYIRYFHAFFTIFLQCGGTDISVIFGMFCTKFTKCGRTDISVIFKEFLHNSYDAGGRIYPLF